MLLRYVHANVRPLPRGIDRVMCRIGRRFYMLCNLWIFMYFFMFLCIVRNFMQIRFLFTIIMELGFVIM